MVDWCVQAVESTAAEDLTRLKIYKPKSREGAVDRVMDGYIYIRGDVSLSRDERICGMCSQTLIGKNFFTKEADMSAFIGMKIKTELGEK